VISDVIAAAVEALEAAGLRVAERSGDITPPCCYLHIGSVTDNGGPLTGGLVVTLYVFYIPVRGTDTLIGDGQALDALYQALAPLASAEFPTTRTTVTVNQDTWPAYRADLAALTVAYPATALEV
jgi:hypothetical protein